MRPEVILILVLGLGALIIVIANDWWKRRLVERGRHRGRKVRKDLLVNKTSWGVVLAIITGIALYAYLANHPELTDRDFGPLTPLVEWLFQKSDA